MRDARCQGGAFAEQKLCMCASNGHSGGPSETADYSRAFGRNDVEATRRDETRQEQKRGSLSLDGGRAAVRPFFHLCLASYPVPLFSPFSSSSPPLRDSLCSF